MISEDDFKNKSYKTKHLLIALILRASQVIPVGVEGVTYSYKQNRATT